MILYSFTKGIKKFLSKLQIPHSCNLNTTVLRGTPIIRLGNFEGSSIDENFTVYNRFNNVYQMFDKRSFLPSLKQTYEINGITLVSPKSAEKYKTYTDILYIGKNKNGKIKVLFDTYSDFEKHFNDNTRKGWYYYVQNVNAREFKVHCGHGKILLFYEKNIISDSEKNSRLIKQTEYNSFIKELKTCLLLVNNLSLDFGTVDFSLQGKDIVITDFNLLPSFTTDTVINKYVKYFHWLYSMEKRQHFNYMSFNKGESLKWKNNQLTNNNILDYIEESSKNKLINLNDYKVKKKSNNNHGFILHTRRIVMPDLPEHILSIHRDTEGF